MIHSTPGVRSDLFKRPLNETLLTDFFGGVSDVELLTETEPEPVSESESEPGDERSCLSTLDFEGVKEESKRSGTATETRKTRRRRRRAESAEELLGQEGTSRPPERFEKTLLLAVGFAILNILALVIARRHKL